MAREAQHYRDSTGKEIHGLAQRPTKNGTPGRFYAIKARNKTFGREPIEAIRRFRLWEAEQSKSSVDLIDAAKSVMIERRSNGNVTYSVRQGKTHRIPEEVFWAALRDMLIDTPKLMAEKTGIEQLGYLTDLQPPAPSIKVGQVSEIYQDKKNCGDKEKSQGKMTWTEFVKIIRQVDQVKTLRDIQQRHIEHYHDWVHAQLGKWTPPTIKRRFGSIRTQLRYALKRSSDKEQVRRVLDLTALFEPPKDHNGTNPQPISVDDFTKLLKACRHDLLPET